MAKSDRPQPTATERALERLLPEWLNGDLQQADIAKRLNVSQPTVSRLLKKYQGHSAVIDTIRGLASQIGLPMYCTSLREGQFLFANQAFADLVGRPLQSIMEKGFQAESLYAEPANRRKWMRVILDQGLESVAVHAELLKEVDAEGRSRSERVQVIDIATRLEGLDNTVVGVLGLATDWEEWALNRNRLAAYREVLEHISDGVHEIDQDGRLTFMNRAEREMLEVSENWLEEMPHVAQLTSSSESNKARLDASKSRVNVKIVDGLNLARGGPRSFRKRPGVPAGEDCEFVPVSIRDIPVQEPNWVANRRRNRQILTIVKDPRVNKSIARCLRHFGPRNPRLEELGISTFIATSSEYAARRLSLTVSESATSDLVFTYANRNFLNELVDLSTYSNCGVSSLADICGKTQAELWNVIEDHSDQIAHQDYGTVYAAVDRLVMETGRTDERIEAHPAPLRGKEVLVQVIKLPHFDPMNPSEIVGVEGFYWPVDTNNVADVQKGLTEKLEAMYDPFRILDDIPVPVFVKDSALRFVYANQAYVQDLKNTNRQAGQPVRDIRDIIGYTDRDLFDASIAERYEADDILILTERKPEVRQLEEHGAKEVHVIKRPVFRDHRVVGVQGVFWDTSPPSVD